MLWYRYPPFTIRYGKFALPMTHSITYSQLSWEYQSRMLYFFFQFFMFLEIVWFYIVLWIFLGWCMPSKRYQRLWYTSSTHAFTFCLFIVGHSIWHFREFKTISHILIIYAAILSDFYLHWKPFYRATYQMGGRLLLRD
jgi:hypothetical protein